ncbi:hypothetical protein LY90DRAFT_669680, partial [Neocallimastix californiae]|jgi:endonuclease/exonuclease/phosphatase family metal-dependent hydrolase
MEDIRILSYNVFLRPPPVHDKLSDYKEERVKLLGEMVIPNYDIICFEEAFGSLNNRREELINYGIKHGLNYSHSDKAHSFCNLRVDGGLLMLSRYPIVEKDSIEYPRGCHSDWLASKGALYIRLKVGYNKHINIFSTHLQASYDEYPQPNSKSVKVRMKQALLLHKFIYQKMKHHKNEPCFVMGDFNVDGIRQPEEVENKGWYSDKADLKDKDLDVYAHSNEYIALVNILKGNLEGVPEEYRPEELPETPLLGTNDITTRFNVRDLIYEFQDPKLHPVTTSNFRGSDQPFEKKSLDYIFEITPFKEECYNYHYHNSSQGRREEEEECKTLVDEALLPHNDNDQCLLIPVSEFLNSDSKDYKVCHAEVVPYKVDEANFKYISDHLSVSTTVKM